MCLAYRWMSVAVEPCSKIAHGQRLSEFKALLVLPSDSAEAGSIRL